MEDKDHGMGCPIHVKMRSMLGVAQWPRKGPET